MTAKTLTSNGHNNMPGFIKEQHLRTTVMTTIFITVLILALYYYMYETYVRILRFGFSCRRSPLLF